MKTINLILMFVIATLFYSCGGSNQGKVENAETVQNQQNSQENDSYKKEDMIKILNKYNIIIPEEFVEVSFEGGHLVYEAVDVEGEIKTQLEDAFEQMRAALKNAGFAEEPDFSDNQNLGGIFKRGLRYEKPAGGKTELILLGYDYIESSKEMILTISHYPEI